jgi:hypothetical protein
MTTQFEIGQTYQSKQNPNYTVTILNRSAKFVTFEERIDGKKCPFGSDTLRKRINASDKGESVVINYLGDVYASHKVSA